MTRYHELVILRETPEGLYEQMVEVWHQLGQQELGGKIPRKLISATPTGRKYRLTRKVGPEEIEANPELHGPRRNEVIRCPSPHDFMWYMFEQVEGTPGDLNCSQFGPRPPEYDQ